MSGANPTDNFANVVDIRSGNGNTATTFIKDEIIACLTCNEVNTIKEHGMPDVTWSKSLPTSER
jgi:hypothetical protein